MEHAGRVTRASSPRAFGRLWPSWSTPGRKPERRAPEGSVGSLVALMEHAGRVIRASSSQAFGRLACGSHGARRMVTRASSPRAFDRLVLEHTVVWEIFIRYSNKSIVGGL